MRRSIRFAEGTLPRGFALGQDTFNKADTMRQRYQGPEQNIQMGTEYARSIARFRPRHRRRSSMTDYLSHPLAPMLGLGLLAAGVYLLWGVSDGRRSFAQDGDVDYADYPPA